MSIFNIDWNNDGNIDFKDTAIDAMILDDLEQDEKDDDDNDFSFFDNDDDDDFVSGIDSI